MNQDKIKELKKKNGNKYIKNNDLLWYIVSRLDDLEKESSKDREELTKVKTQIKIFWVFLPVAITLALFVTTLL